MITGRRKMTEKIVEPHDNSTMSTFQFYPQTLWLYLKLSKKLLQTSKSGDNDIGRKIVLFLTYVVVTQQLKRTVSLRRFFRDPTTCFVRGIRKPIFNHALYQSVSLCEGSFCGIPWLLAPALCNRFWQF